MRKARFSRLVRSTRELAMNLGRIYMGYQLYIQILAQYNPTVLHACYCEGHDALTAGTPHASNFRCRRRHARSG